MQERPHNVVPDKSSVRAAICYKNFAAFCGISHIGLGVSGNKVVQYLRNNGWWIDIWPVNSAADIATKLKQTTMNAQEMGQKPVSHVIISAPWIPTPNLQAFTIQYPNINWCVLSHSNAGFLQADPNGVKLLREASQLAAGTHNFSVAGNSRKFASWWSRAYNVPVVYLPNLYGINATMVRQRQWVPGSLLKIGLFGAQRPLKNFVSGAGAIVEMCSRLKTQTEMWISTNRAEGDGQTVMRSVAALTANVPDLTVKYAGWSSWPQFNQIVGSMHLLVQPSYTESFNMVTADGISQGIPSVVSDAIDWVPHRWSANPDDVNDIANVGINLLHDPSAAAEGINALQTHNRQGLASWEHYFLQQHKAAYV